MTWTIDAAHSHVGFSVKYLMIATVRGQFKGYSGRMHIDWEDFTRSSVEGEIDVATIDTADPARDEHLRSGDFFDTASHPKAHFRSDGIERIGEDRYKVFGTLTIRGISRPVSLDVDYAGKVTDPRGNHKLGFSAVGLLHRKDFGLVWNQALDKGGVLVGDLVKVELDILAVHPADPTGTV